ncbi:3'-5' exonuclease [Cohaesibacter haloalkalitolerans]|uniref:3'-5' exonuclease n=1 Tax=Cohaesibacter haloalkalitolerans TaxID=1162980 RepID=UPI001FE18535|nr:3'-5' exonuclease [Cohaesibacter haloalkalitolerans]
MRTRGVPVRIAEDGWATSPVVRAACAALSYAANPADAYAALVLRTLGPDPLSLQAAMQAQIQGRLTDDPTLMRLAALSDHLARLPISNAVDLVINASGLRIWAGRQPDAAQAPADLLRLEAEASDFESAHRDLKSAAGFHGESVKVFLGWLAALASERDFDRRPDPAANSAEAVEIVTWHASKGREWPITVVAEFDHGIEDWPGSTATRFTALDEIDDMDAALASAALIHTPGFAAPEAERRFIEDRRTDFEANAKNLLYVAMTRARDRLVLEWPGFLKERDEEAPEAKCLFHVFTDACAPRIGGDKLHIGGIDCPAIVRQLPEHAGFTEYLGGEITDTPRLGSAIPLPTVVVTPWRLKPSQATTALPAPDGQAIKLGTPWPRTVSDAARGTAIHLALRTCLTRPDLVAALHQATGLDDATLALVAERAATLKALLSSDGYTNLLCEIPLLGHTKEGAEIPGMIDLLATGPKGCLLIDHKTGGAGKGFGLYWPQLSSYAALVERLFPQHPLQGVAVFWVDHGLLELAKPQYLGEATNLTLSF